MSTERQLEGTSPEKQLEKIKQLASQQGYALEPEHIWMIAESGAKQDRLGFKQAITAVQNGGITRLYVYSIDRLGRYLTDLLFFLREMEDHDIEVWSAEKEELLQENDFNVQILGAVASYERQQIYRRTQDGLRRSIQAGKYCGGIIAYGYQLNPETKELEINEQEANVVRMMFSWCIDERMSCVQIADRLNALQIPTHYTKDGRTIRYKGKREAEKTAGIWRAGRVRNMLKNPAYCGQWEWGKRTKKVKNQIRIPGYSPAIVSEEIFRSASNVLQRNRLYKAEKPIHEYLLRGLIRCGLCGKAFCGATSKVGPNHTLEKQYYICNGKTQWHKLGILKCPSVTLVAKDIEDAVWSDIQGYCKNPNVAIEQLKCLRKPIDDTVPAQIIETKRQISECERKEANIIRMASESQEISISKVDELLRENRKQKEALLNYLDQLTSEKGKSDNLDIEFQDINERLSYLNGRIDNATFVEKRNAICELVKDIVVTPEEHDGKTIPVVNITYKFNDLRTKVKSSIPAFIAGCTPAPVAITATNCALAPAPSRSSPTTRNASPDRCSIGSTSTSKCRAWITRSSAASGRVSLPARSGCASKPPGSGN